MRSEITMAGRRLALVVAVDHYDHSGLRRLAAPGADAAALAEVLGDPDLGGFDVTVVRNERSSVICERIEELLAARERADLVLLHFSCHGLKDEAGELYLAATNTVPDRLASTAVEAALVGRLMRRSLAQRVVLLLDCCYGGAFERGLVHRAGGDIDVGGQFLQDRLGGGRGRAIITASTAMEYAFEGSRLTGGLPDGPSLFTGAVVEGIRTGDADRDQDGRIALGELYDYVYDRVRASAPYQTPCKWEFGLQGDLYLARNPRRRIVPGSLPQEVLDLARYPAAAGRLGAVAELGRLAAGTDPRLAAAARLELTRLTEDDSRQVSEAATEALGAIGEAGVVEPRPATVPRPVPPAPSTRDSTVDTPAPGAGAESRLTDELPAISPPLATYAVPGFLLFTAVALVASQVAWLIAVLPATGALASAVLIAVNREAGRRRRRLLEALIVRDRQRRVPPSR
jgi:hypothetical protein